ncbi:hypothetical protein ACIA58_22895 [Kribbella sp. NPDC051586]|uniref:hypothetical protein n=1 Tax=Kribbella sp. NPDC051586 TaxID=3364118 RepID=UPI0037A71724
MNTPPDNAGDMQDIEGPALSSRRRFLMQAAAGSAGVVVAGLLPGTASASTSAAVGPTAAGSGGPSASEPAVLFSTSFENSSDNVFLTAAATFDPTQFHSGTRSLKYDRTDNTSYVFTGPAIDGSCGRYDEISGSVWVKTANLSGGGASFAVEWRDAAGNYMTGAYSQSSNLGDWTQLTIQPQAVPAGAATMQVIFYLSRGQTGTAWYDDLVLYLASPRVLRAKLAAPNYRGLLIPGQPQDIDLRIEAFRPTGASEALGARVVLADSRGRTVDTKNFPDQTPQRYRYSLKSRPYGDYTVTVTARDRAGTVVGTPVVHQLKKLSAEQIPTSYIDNFGRLIRDGQPYFTLGCYDFALAEDNLAAIAGMNFNSVQTYHSPTQAQMDLAHSHGLGVLYVHKTDPPVISELEQFRDHPALLAWYINDEVSLSEHRAALRARYQAVMDNDPNHPAYSVDYRTWPGDDEEYVTDVFGSDHYPVKNHPDTDTIEAAGRSTARAIAEMPGYPNWPVIQIAAEANNGINRPPTEEQVRTMAWHAITVGSTGLFFYSYFDQIQDHSGADPQQLVAGTTRVVGEIRSLTDALLATGRLPVKVNSPSEWITWTTRRTHDGKRYLFVVNSSRTSRTVTFSGVPGHVATDVRTNAVTAISAHTLEVTLPSLAVGLYQLTD